MNKSAPPTGFNHAHLNGKDVSVGWDLEESQESFDCGLLPAGDTKDSCDDAALAGWVFFVFLCITTAVVFFSLLEVIREWWVAVRFQEVPRGCLKDATSMVLFFWWWVLYVCYIVLTHLSLLFRRIGVLALSFVYFFRVEAFFSDANSIGADVCCWEPDGWPTLPCAVAETHLLS